MNKNELTQLLSEETGLSRRDASKFLEAFVRIVLRSLQRNEKVSVTGFGTFWVSFRPERMGVNPMTGEKIRISATAVPRFKAGKRLKEAMKEVSVPPTAFPQEKELQN